MWLAKLGILLALVASPAVAQNWLMVEVRDIPLQCTQPLSCMAKSKFVSRSLIHLPSGERNALLQGLNRLASIRGLPEVQPTGSLDDIDRMIPVFHSLPEAEKLAPLANHPGVFFDPSKLDSNDHTKGFSLYVREKLSEAGVRFLTKAEWETTPGRPTLSVRFTKRAESAGCIIPFSISLALSEETVLARNPSIKITGRVWSGVVRENLANLNFTTKSALAKIVESFTKDWTSQNPK